MSKKAFIIILILSVVVTYGASLLDALMGNTLLAGESGIPFKYSRSTLFGRGSINYTMMLLNIAFWSVVIWGAWKVLQKVISRR
ncbi:hypothetical protein HYS94_02885 [Candidatus Daviesbacteria bacterium]|nr:hypothetical protein [Candidatus Daviesbacteria bacterium]